MAKPAKAPSPLPEKTPRQYDFRMPAEWEPQDAVWITWPADARLWPGLFKEILPVFAELVALLSRYQNVLINGANLVHDDILRMLAKAGAHLDRTTLYDHASNDVWCRDHGPIFVKNDSADRLAVTDWRFNGWGGKYSPFDLDDRIPRKIARELRLPRFSFDITLEGGAIDVNGAGTLMTTEAVLLNPNRKNPPREQIEEALREAFWVDQIIWLEEGIAADDTDGHIDNLARFFKEDGIIVATEDNADDPNYRSLAKAQARLHGAKTATDGRFDLVSLPMPHPVLIGKERLSASYLNFLVVNSAVIVPQFGQNDRDHRALEVLRECFPDRELVPFRCNELLLEGGAVHCLTQQQPAVGDPPHEG